MTAYHGGKQRIGLEVAQAIADKCARLNVRTLAYIEPFCGMLGVFRRIPALLDADAYFAGDQNESVIAMWRALQRGTWKPPRDCSETRYIKLKRQRAPSAERGYIGHQYSFGGSFFGAYRFNYIRPFDAGRARQRVLDIATTLKRVEFSAGGYEQFSGARDCVIYCDPPYDDTANNYLEKFDYPAFERWCVEMSKHNLVFVSSMKPVRGAELLYSRDSATSYKGRMTTRSEKLYFIRRKLNFYK